MVIARTEPREGQLAGVLSMRARDLRFLFRLRRLSLDSESLDNNQIPQQSTACKDLTHVLGHEDWDAVPLVQIVEQSSDTGWNVPQPAQLSWKTSVSRHDQLLPTHMHGQQSFRPSP